MKRITQWLVKGLLIMLLPFSCFAQNATVIQDSAFYFKNQLPPESLTIALNQVAFSKQPDGRFNFGFSPDEYCYIVLKISTDSAPGTYMLSIDNTSLDMVQAFSMAPGGQRNLLYRSGNLMKYDAGRNYVWHTFPLKASPDPHFYLIAVKALSKNVNLQYRIMPPGDLQKIYRNFDRVICFYAGIIIFIVLISFLAFLLLRNYGLLLYIGYLLSVTTWILSHYGYFFPIFHPAFPRVNDVAKMISSLLAIIFFLCLILYLFKHDIRNRIFGRLIKALLSVNLFVILLALVHLVIIFPPKIITYLNIIWHALLVLSACASVPLLLSLFRTGRSAKIFCFAAACPFIMLFVQIFSNAGYISYQFLNDHGVLLANLLEIIILLSGIIFNIWDNQKSRDEQLRLLEEDRRNTLKKLIMVQDHERKRIAEELHDSIGPLLAAIRINFLRSIKAERENRRADALIAKTENIIDDSILEIRNIAHQLMPKGLSSKGLVTLLSEYFDDLQNIYPPRIEFDSDITTALNDDFQLNLYRIISELVLNAAKHSDAKFITVSMATPHKKIHIMIGDDGKGFGPVQKASGLGLKSIESRVSYLKGTMDIKSAQEEGSCIKIMIPHTES